jgi:putative ABC transport system permease protein
MAAVIDDIRHGLRAVTQQPGNSLIIVAVLALGLAGVIGMLSILKAMVWDPLPFPAADRLVQAGWRDRANDFPDDVRGLRGADLLDWRERLGPMARVIGQGQATINLASDEAVERYDGSFVTANLFATLGVAPALGRDFRAEDEQPGAAPVLILSHDLWRTRFGADPGVLGRILRANAMPATVIGVMPPDFSFPYREQVWMNASLSATVPVDQDRNFEVFIEPLTGNAGLAPINAVLENWIGDVQQREPGTWKPRELAMLPMAHYFTDPPTRQLLNLMLMTVALVLLVACANVANMMLARALARGRDLVVRLTLGASRARVARLLLAQSFALTLIAAVLAVPLAQLGIDWIVSSFADTDSGPPPWMDFSIDGEMVAATVVVGLLTALIVGLLPVLRLRVNALGDALRDGGRSVVGGGVGRLAKWLVAGELALACVVLLTTLVMVRGVARLEHTDLGIDPTNLLTARVALFPQAYPEDTQTTQFIERFTDTLRREPGVLGAAATTTLPGLTAEQESMLPEGLDPGDAGAPSLRFGVVDLAFIQTLGIELRAGRGIETRDRADTDPVIVIDERFAQTVYPNTDPLGRRVRIPADGENARWYTIVGVIETMQLEDVGDAVLPSALLPLAQNPRRFVSLVVRTQADPAQMKPRFQELLRAQDPDTPAYWLRTYEEVMRVAMAGERVLSGMFSAFGVIALVLAAAGLYGLIAQLVGQRTREIGVQRALGASGPDVLRHVLGSTLPQVAGGLGIGMLLAVPFASQISNILPELTLDAWAVALLVLILGSVATVAALVPARRALTVDPMHALRQD